MAYLLYLTFQPSGDPRVEGWSFRVDHTEHRGWMGGDLPMAARGALASARSSRRPMGIMLTLPRAGLLGLCSRRFVIHEPGDVAALRSVDVDRLRARHRAAARRGVAMARARVAVLRAWGMLRSQLRFRVIDCAPPMYKPPPHTPPLPPQLPGLSTHDHP